MPAPISEKAVSLGRVMPGAKVGPASYPAAQPTSTAQTMSPRLMMPNDSSDAVGTITTKIEPITPNSAYTGHGVPTSTWARACRSARVSGNAPVEGMRERCNGETMMSTPARMMTMPDAKTVHGTAGMPAPMPARIWATAPMKKKITADTVPARQGLVCSSGV